MHTPKNMASKEGSYYCRLSCGHLMSATALLTTPTTKKYVKIK